MSSASYAVCDPGEGGEIDRLCCYRPCAAGKLCGACPRIVGAAYNLNGCGGGIGTCIGKCIVGIIELKLLGEGCDYGIGLAVLVNHILRNGPLDIVVIKRLGINGPGKICNVAVCKRVVRVTESEGNGRGVGICIGSLVAGDAADTNEGRVFSLNGCVYALFGAVILKRICVIPLNEIRCGESLGINLYADLVRGSGSGIARDFNSDNAVVVTGLGNVCNLKSCGGCTVNEHVVLVPSVRIGCRSNIGSCGSGKDDGALAVYDALSGCGELSGSLVGKSVKLNVLCGHLGILVSLGIYPSYDGKAVIIGSA